MATLLELSLLEKLPPEIIHNILVHLPGYCIGAFCNSSTTCNNTGARRCRQMMLVHRVRGRLMSYIIKLMHRHFHFTRWDGGKYLNVIYNLPSINITSVTKFKAERKRLLELWNETADDPSRKCDCCGRQLGWSYYVLDGEDPAPPITLIIYIYCYACYHRGVLGFHNQYKRLPTKAGDHREVQLIASNTKLEPVPEVPLTLSRFFQRMEGGVYNFNRK